MVHQRWRGARRSALALGGAAVAVCTALGTLTTGATAQPAGGATTDARPWVAGTHTIAYFSKAQTIHEEVDVQTGMDSDHDGTIDTIRVDIDRPDTARGQKVPLIIHASPYFFEGTRDAWEPGFFVPHGYAVATVALPGTDFSSGCEDVGGYREVLGTKAVIDWANGRQVGHYTNGGGVADATQWTNGKTGMIGVSWDGTIANAVASTGVKGLVTIVPVAAISNWYDYTRGNGIPFYPGHVQYLADYVSNYNSQNCVNLSPKLQTKSDDSTGNFNPWWAVRDFRLDASKIKASVFVVAGLNDENVKTIQFGKWWEQLEKYNVTRRIFLHQGQHVEPFYSYGSNYSTPLLQWMDYYLQGLDNGEPGEPRAIIQREDNTWSTDEEWPPTGTTDTTFALSRPLGRTVGSLGVGTAAKGTRYVTISQAAAQSADSIVQNPTTPRSDRAVFLSDELSNQIRESGTATVTLRVKVDQPTAGFQARVVDYSGSTGFIVSRTEADLGHYDGLDHDVTLQPGKYYTLTWQINTDDRIYAKGDVLGLVITAEQSNPTEPYQAVKATIDTTKSSITFPLLGDAKSLHGTGAVAPIVGKLVGPPGPAKTVQQFVHEFLYGSNS